MTAHPTLRIIRDEHGTLSAVLRSIALLLSETRRRGAKLDYQVLRAMLFYIDEFPERRHHPKESDVLFPKLARAAPSLMPVIHRLEIDHMQGEQQVRALQHLLLAWELLGESRRDAFADATRQYVNFYREHMRSEEVDLLPVAERALDDKDWADLDQAFKVDRDPLVNGSHDPCYDRLFARVTLAAPAPTGTGASLQGCTMA